MKKLLSILGAVGLTATASSSVVACSSDKATVKVDGNIIENDAKTMKFTISQGDASKLGIIKLTDSTYSMNKDDGMDLNNLISTSKQALLSTVTCDPSTGVVNGLMRAAVNIPNNSQVKFKLANKQVLGIDLKADLVANTFYSPDLKDIIIDNSNGDTVVNAQYKLSKPKDKEGVYEPSTIAFDSKSIAANTLIGVVVLSEETAFKSDNGVNISYDQSTHVVIIAPSNTTKKADLQKAFTMNSADPLSWKLVVSIQIA
ncbi:lipoprotein [Mesoplasma lactucae]|uniref:Uncharacterized protein n=1 Tax=Mesoplasma lactucae ATCC 49193 TaxID=81460 RepID=A0A291IRA5_9MOLU|nr:lipoprotein [Mesoplasma lactucae]ATG97303.1 hypothetical protein CP520_00825 [Mesoplasma lactucae ATCC 49193]ATZ20247.1 hypothetical protein MLACT_v1c04260 [Mesoplasma lactucae ATCC 49193]MCL8216996.1 hypothetical protein [Mesoplasma lactucae ATCC 49193]